MKYKNPANLLFLAFAAYRAARLVALDDGPGHFFEKLRKWAEKRAERETNEVGPWHSLAELVGCPFCAGVWLTAFLLLVDKYGGKVGQAFLALLAVSGAQAFMQSLDQSD